jgi:hypothetical protein
MSSFNWNAEEFEFEEVDESAALESDAEVLDGTVHAPLELVDEGLEELRAEMSDAQAAASSAIEVGDYQAAAYHQELAEEAADSLPLAAPLEGPSSLELQRADALQDHALDLEAQQAEMAQAGDYAAARELASDAAYDLKASDQLAGGSDHSGQAQLEVANMEWADWHQQISDDMLTSAADYANYGDAGTAQNYLQGAINHSESADHYGDLGEHGGALAATDPAAPIEAHHVDTYTSSSTSASTISTSSAIDTTSSASSSSDTTGSDDVTD